MRKVLLSLFFLCSTVFAENPVYQIDTDTITIHSAIVWSDGSIQVSSPTTSAGTAPGGNQFDIQFNDSGFFNGSDMFTCNPMTKKFALNADGTAEIIFNDSTGNSLRGGMAVDSQGLELISDANIVANLASGGTSLIIDGLSDVQWQFNAEGSLQFAVLSSSSALTASEGKIFYNSTTHHFYGYDGTTWKQLDN